VGIIQARQIQNRERLQTKQGSQVLRVEASAKSHERVSCRIHCHQLAKNSYADAHRRRLARSSYMRCGRMGQAQNNPQLLRNYPPSHSPIGPHFAYPKLRTTLLRLKLKQWMQWRAGRRAARHY
jgi:hypothetical protein